MEELRDEAQYLGATVEPLEHLAGCEDMIAEFKEREKQLHAELV